MTRPLLPDDALLERLVAFDTTSHLSNLPLVDFVDAAAAAWSADRYARGRAKPVPLGHRDRLGAIWR